MKSCASRVSGKPEALSAANRLSGDLEDEARYSKENEDELIRVLNV